MRENNECETENKLGENEIEWAYVNKKSKK